MNSKYKHLSISEFLFDRGCYFETFANQIVESIITLLKGRFFLLTMAVGLFIFPQSSCTKLVEVEAPVTSTSEVNVYTSDATAAAVLTGIYTNISNSYFSNGGIASLSLFAGLSADELKLYNGSTNTTYIRYYTNALSTSPPLIADFWNAFYPVIFIANSAIEGLANSNSLTPAIKQQLVGEAKFIRAFCYFYLVNLYGDVPLITGTDYTVNAVFFRTLKSRIYQQIIADLKNAQTLLSSNYLDATLLNITDKRVRPTQGAAAALLARVYLYTGDWVDAEAEATNVITNTGAYNLINDLNSVFLANSKEAIWQLQPVGAGVNTPDGLLFIIPIAGLNNGPNPVCLNTNLLNSFETGDQRRTYWIDSVRVNSATYYYPYKYKINTPNVSITEYEMIFRLSEQYLIRAEARAQQGNISGAKNDLNIIRNRAGLASITAADKASLIIAIQHERQVELFTEWGHRWLDLKRTGTVDAVMNVVTPLKGGVWRTNWQWYPISLYELQHDQNLEQNSGY
ncbi:MAG TPA: RagB/SusD family nutrient uptake outer membrane protein [Puia sp.]|nr:RagB/SusD family nutrient uptake outer membrane protein [Puia sp.]